jgi:hypothetical protein
MNSDPAVIQIAYEEALKRLYAMLLDGYIQAAGDPVQEQQAEQRFKTGVGLGRRSRDRAIALMA